MLLNRRFFLKSSGALLAYLGVSPLHAIAGGRVIRPRVAPNKTMVIIFLRGGADGLNLVVPHGDGAYADLRKTISIPSPTSGDGKAAAAIDLDGYFGLHPALAPMLPFFESGMAAAVHAVGYDKNTRSHFEEQDVWETGVVGNTVGSDGWVNRHLATSEGRGPLRAVSIGDNLPRILRGKAQAYAIRGLDDLAMPKTGSVDPALIAAALEHAYTIDPAKARAPAQDMLAQSADSTLDGIETLRTVVTETYKPAAPYPETGLAKKLMQVARLVKANVGVEIAEVDYDGWDTHQNQGGAAGQFADRARELSGAIAAFTADLGEKMNDVLLVTLTDFGRTAKENGTGGTDHGWANCMFMVGGAVARGTALAARPGAAAGDPRRVLGKWPGLAEDQLHQKRDLLHTTDFRDVLCELVRVHLGNPNLEAVLPSHRFTPLGLIG